MRSVLPTTTKSLEGSLLSNLSHLDPPQMPLHNTQKGSITLFKVGAEMIHHLNNGDEKCWMGCALPVQMTKPPAPHELLKTIRCSRKIKCTTRCTCITYRLKCNSMCRPFNILCAGNKSPMQERFFKNNAGNLLPALMFLGGLCNFCNYTFFNVSHDM